MEFVKELLNWIKEYFPKKIAGAIILIVLLVVGLYYFLSSEYYTSHYRLPKWNYSREEQKDLFISDIPLKTGYIIVAPQIVVKFDEKIVFIIDILSYYEVNGAELNDNSEDERTFFELSILEKQEKKYSECYTKIKQAIIEQVREKASDKADKIEFLDVKLVRVESQNLESNKSRCQYLYVTDTVEKEIQEREAQLRSTVYHIDLDSYNGDITSLIDACVEKIINLD